jgi:hypothetical protein
MTAREARQHAGRSEQEHEAEDDEARCGHRPEGSAAGAELTGSFVARAQRAERGDAVVVDRQQQRGELLPVEVALERLADCNALGLAMLMVVDDRRQVA